MDVELPNGHIIEDVPEGTTKTEIMRKAVNAGLAKYEDFGEKLDPTAGESFLSNAAAGFGKAFVDTGRGIHQLASKAGLASDNQADIDESRRLDSPLMHTGGGLVGDIAGNAAIMAAPGAAISKAGQLAGLANVARLGRAFVAPGTYGEAALAGGAMGALAPTATGESRGTNALLGVVGGVAGRGIGDVAGRILRPVQSELSNEGQRLAESAAQEGIPLRASQATGSQPLGYIESALESIPTTAGRQAELNASQRAAYTAAALRRAGIDGSQASPEILAARKSALGNTFEDIAGRNAIDFNQGAITNQLADVADNASRRLTDANAAPVQRMVDDILSALDGNGQLPGPKYQGFREELRRLSSGNDTQAHYFGRLKRALDDAFTSQISGDDAAAWKEASRQYGNLKTIMQAMGANGEAAANNQIAPNQLAIALRQAVGKEGRALGRGDLDTLARIGQAFLRPLPNSGTAQRQLAQMLITGGGPAAAALALTGDPQKAAEYGAIGAGTSLALPRLIQAMINSGAGQAYLKSNLSRSTPTQVKALVNALRNAGTLGSAALLPQTAQQ